MDFNSATGWALDCVATLALKNDLTDLGTPPPSIRANVDETLLQTGRTYDSCNYAPPQDDSVECGFDASVLSDVFGNWPERSI